MRAAMVVSTDDPVILGYWLANYEDDARRLG